MRGREGHLTDISILIAGPALKIPIEPLGNKLHHRPRENDILLPPLVLHLGSREVQIRVQEALCDLVGHHSTGGICVRLLGCGCCGLCCGGGGGIGRGFILRRFFYCDGRLRGWR